MNRAVYLLALAACNHSSSGAFDIGADAAVDLSPQVVPSNAGAVGPLRPTGLTVAPPNGRFSTDADCTSPSVFGDCAAIAQANGPALCVCRADTLAIGDLRVSGTRGLVVLAWDEVDIIGTLDASAASELDGPGATRDAISPAMDVTGGAGGVTAATPEVVPLVAGTSGQDACNSRPAGGGGGVLQITAGRAVVVTGAVLAGGGGGHGGSSTGTCLGGPGGGSGGSVLLEARTVTVSGGVGANGGGGGGGGANEFGGGGLGDGGALAVPAAGGAGNDGHGCSAAGFTNGGDGGNGATDTLPPGRGRSTDSISGCFGGTIFVGAGGDGGAVGRIRVNTETGCNCGGTFSPAPSIGGVVIR